MPEFHRLLVTSSPAGLLFECAVGCGRRLVVERASGTMTIIDRGDPYAFHRGDIGDVEVDVPVLSPG